MKQFFIDLGNNDIYKNLMKEPLTYVAGAALLAIFQIANFSSLGSGWGVTGPFAFWGAWVFEALGGDASIWSFFASESSQATLNNGFLNHGPSLRNIGLIGGALTATLFASQFKFKKIKSKKQIAAAIIGGLMMGYGARMAGGCNIGALFTAIISLSLSGWVFAIFLLIGAFIGSRLLVKFFM